MSIIKNVKSYITTLHPGTIKAIVTSLSVVLAAIAILFINPPLSRNRRISKHPWLPSLPSRPATVRPPIPVRPIRPNISQTLLVRWWLWHRPNNCTPNQTKHQTTPKSSMTLVYYRGYGGYYWSSSIRSAEYAYRLYLNSGSVNSTNNFLRYLGHSVRCVQNQ